MGVKQKMNNNIEEVRREAWIHFASALISKKYSTAGGAACEADRLLAEFDKRFCKEQKSLLPLPNSTII